MPVSRASSRVPFWRAGHTPTLVAAFLYFNFTFMAWVLLGPLAVQIAADLKLSASEQGLIVAIPLLAGAVLRVVLGMLADRVQPRMAGALGQAATIVALWLVWVIGVTTYTGVLALGVVLGIAGASFAVALRLAMGAYPPEHQGMALGLAGAGNFGTVLVALCGPGLAVSFGWQNVLGLALIPLALCFAYYLHAARDSDEPAPVRTSADYLRVMRNHDALWFMFFYAVTFGGFVGLASYLTVYFSVQFGLPATTAGYCAAVCCAVGSVFRPFGVRFAERFGAIRALAVLYGAAALFLVLAAFIPLNAAFAVLLFSGAMLALGMGNGAVFQVVPQRFRREINELLAIIGSVGAVGGFVLAALLGYSRELSGSYQLGLLLFAGCAVVAMIGLAIVKHRWRNPFRTAGAVRA